VLVTHDLERASAVADEALILLAGRVVQRSGEAGLERPALEDVYARALEAGLSEAEVA